MSDFLVDATSSNYAENEKLENESKMQIGKKSAARIEAPKWKLQSNVTQCKTVTHEKL